MTLFRSIRRRPTRLLADFNREVDEARAVAARQMRGEMPPRPQLREPVPGADTRPRWGTGPDPAFDPCGNGPVQVRDGSEEKGGER